MRVFFTLVFITAVCQCSEGQDEQSVRSLKEEADRFYAEEQYNLAIEDYQELADKNPKDADVGYKLAESYRKTFNYTEAETYYLKAYFLSPKQYPLSLYYFSLMLKFNGSFDEAIQYFTEFINLHTAANDFKDQVEQAIIDRSGCETAKEELGEKNGFYPPIQLKLNTKFNDFAPAVLDSVTVVISSGRIFSNKQSIDERFGEAFTDNYYYQKEGANWTDKTKQVFAITNTKFNDGSGSFNHDGDKYYFTVCGSGGPQCKIFVTRLKDNKWTEPIALNNNVNQGPHEARQPAVSYGGDSLVFASNRPGGNGGFDLWMCVDAGDDNWGPAMNLGVAVNTKLNELSPAFTSFPNVLFFASDGHEGYGGLDLYMSKRLSTGEVNLYNLGSPFNSNRDDCFLSFSERELYWSTNRQEGLGGFDINAVKIPSVPAFISRLSLKKRNARRDINLKQKLEESQTVNLQASRLEEKIEYEKLTYEKKLIVDQLVQRLASNETVTAAQFKMDAKEFEVLSRIASERLHQKNSNTKGYLTRITSPPGSHKDILVTAILQDSISGHVLPGKKVLLTDKAGEVLKITRTNETGTFRFTSLAQGEFYLRLETTSELSEIHPIIKSLSVSAPKEVQLFQVENVYFDFDHYRVRPEARKVLDDLADYLIRNPGAQLEIFAFADDRGTTEYNLKLTQKRGQSVVEYLLRKGVDQTGLAIVAKGKQTANEVDLELQRQFNRRVEFYLNGDAGTFQESAKTYILRKETNWKSIAQQLGLAASTLKSINGVVNDEPLKAFQPVRLPIGVTVSKSELFFDRL